jgi:nicotinate-nucleotide adenylyltransferase
MVEMAINSNRNFKVSGLEIEREGPTYTIDTLRILHDIFPEQELFFITGTDALRELLTWRHPEEIIKLARIVGASRPGYDSRNLLTKINRRYPFTKDRISELEVPALAISSTDIRTRVKNNKSIRYLLPDEIRLFIKDNKLYQNK